MAKCHSLGGLGHSCPLNGLEFELKVANGNNDNDREAITTTVIEVYLKWC